MSFRGRTTVSIEKVIGEVIEGTPVEIRARC